MDTTRNIRQRPDYHHGDLEAALLASAEIELQEKGIEAFSLRGVAKRAGVSHAAPAHHFGTVRGLLTRLAESGFARMIAVQQQKQAAAPPDPVSQLVALGLGYVAFGLDNPALFRLMFSSARPDGESGALAEVGSEAFCLLMECVRNVTGKDPETDPAAMVDVLAAWAAVHGVSDLMISGRMKTLVDMPESLREKALASIIMRAVPAG